MAPLGAKSASPYLDLRGAKLRGRAKMVFSVAISEIRWAESVPSETVLPKRPNMGQIGPQEIGADLAFGADSALSISQCM